MKMPSDKIESPRRKFKRNGCRESVTLFCFRFSLCSIHWARQSPINPITPAVILLVMMGLAVSCTTYHAPNLETADDSRFVPKKTAPISHKCHESTLLVDIPTPIRPEEAATADAALETSGRDANDTAKAARRRVRRLVPRWRGGNCRFARERILHSSSILPLCCNRRSVETVENKVKPVLAVVLDDNSKFMFAFFDGTLIDVNPRQEPIVMATRKMAFIT